jgi:hypothetical protein
VELDDLFFELHVYSFAWLPSSKLRVSSPFPYAPPWKCFEQLCYSPSSFWSNHTWLLSRSALPCGLAYKEDGISWDECFSSSSDSSPSYFFFISISSFTDKELPVLGMKPTISSNGIQDIKGRRICKDIPEEDKWTDIRKKWGWL